MGQHKWTRGRGVYTVTVDGKMVVRVDRAQKLLANGHGASHIYTLNWMSISPSPFGSWNRMQFLDMNWNGALCEACNILNSPAVMRNIPECARQQFVNPVKPEL